MTVVRIVGDPGLKRLYTHPFFSHYYHSFYLCYEPYDFVKRAPIIYGNDNSIDNNYYELLRDRSLFKCRGGGGGGRGGRGGGGG